MTRGIKVSFLLCSFTLCLLLSACVPGVNMQQEALEKGETQRGTVVVGTVSNQRAADEGSESFALIGKLRGGYGNPFDLNTESGREIDVLLREVAAASLAHTGYAADQATGKSVRLDMDVLDFWCDGYMGYKIEAKITAKLVKLADGRTLIQQSIHVERAFPLGYGTYSPMHEAFDEVINDIQKQLVAFMRSEEFHAAAKR